MGDFTTGKEGNGKVAKETRKITEDFTEVSAAEGLMVYVTPPPPPPPPPQADDFKIDVEADENIIDLIATDIKDGKLRVHARENIGRATKKIYVSLPKITALKSSSGAHLKGEHIINGDTFEVDGSSGALIQLALVADNIEIDASSGANLTISGDVNRAQVEVSSGGNIDATALNTKTCDAEASRRWQSQNSGFGSPYGRC